MWNNLQRRSGVVATAAPREAPEPESPNLHKSNPLDPPARFLPKFLTTSKYSSHSAGSSNYQNKVLCYAATSRAGKFWLQIVPKSV